MVILWVMRSRILLLCALLSIIVCFTKCNGGSGDTPPEPEKSNGVPAPNPITITVDANYPHDNQAFTQGLQFYKGKLYEGTGQFEKSSLRIVDIKTGVPEKKYVLPDPKIFGEGITIWNNKIYQLTWENNVIFVYNLNDITKPIQTLKWKLQGWGITNDGKTLIISDGSDKIFYMRPDSANNDVKIMKILSVMDNRGPVDSLNELEYIDGYIYANHWMTNDILKIDTTSGHVVGKISLAGLLNQYDPNAKIDLDADVLNGIAYDSSTKKLYITGKNWPRLFEIRLN